MVDEGVIFSVLTPTWNRANYLKRVYDGLLSQNVRCFEWIIADDGSTDSTENLVREFAEKADFSIVFVRADRHVGKIRMDNEAIRYSRGKFILWCDSDDYLEPYALKRFLDTWNSIPNEKKNDFVGMTALAATEQGCIVNPFPNVDFVDVSWNDLAEIHNVTEDMLFCARTEVLKEHPFPEVDMVIPESVVWTTIGHQLTRMIPDVLKKVEYNADHCISFSGKMSYNRGRAYALATTVSNLKKYKRSWGIQFWRMVTFIRYSIHGEIKVFEAYKLWRDNSSYIVFLLVFPLSFLLVIKDRLQGKVDPTHRFFLESQKYGRITVEVLRSF